MSLTDYLITGAAILISFLIGICSYFIVKWMEGVDATTQKHSDLLTDLTIKVSSFESKQDSSAKDLTKAVQTQLAAIKLPHVETDKIREEIGLIKDVVQKRLLPQIEKQENLVGRVTVLETKTNLFISGLEKLKAKKPPEQK